ncbi:cheA signal transduction histidine kinases [Candidatus Vecturithrix granuli]|uniref:histidine kinase n=1 Tax=Vecturithrix granuli TaxID=1499967 RepID=A0A081BTS7_VECG1|nr:cheA signal transduction histidine kinases [Candidatus Vecturithrix granuli]
MNFDRSQFIGKFAQEAAELVQKLNDGLVRLEKDPQNHEILKDILRVTHTLKGSSKIMRFQNVSQLAHKMEDLLISLQDGHLKFNDDLLELLFQGVDLISQGIDAILHHAEDRIEIQNMNEVFDAALHGEKIAFRITQLNRPHVEDEAPFHQETYARKILSEGEALPHQEMYAEKPGLKPKIQETIRVDVQHLDNAVRLVGEMAVSHKRSERTLTALRDLQRLARKHVNHLHQWFQGHAISDDRKQEMLQQSLLVLKGIEQAFRENRDELAMMNILINELYEDVLTMRMLPLSVLFDTFPRAIRDMARYFQKSVDLRISGEDTMLDKKIIECLNAPFIHILRNCIDHGIETPDERIALGKSQTGLISIAASQRSGRIKIEITDDGRGIQVEKLKQRAIQRGMLSEEKVQTLKPEELIDLVFLPRLSTSDMITDISGRGMGMDIVKVSLEQLKGGIDLISQAGKGTSCILTLPATLTTIRSLIISSGQKLFAIPMNAIQETLQVAAHEIIQVVGHEAIRLRNQIIYIVALGNVLGLKHGAMKEGKQSFIVIVHANGKRVGLIVDEILDEQDVVVKQLPPHLQHAKTIAGATISSDNTIILILHVPEIVELVKHATVDAQKSQTTVQTPLPSNILIVDDSANTGDIEKQILQAYGYQVDVVHDGIQALEQLERRSYDLIVTDIEMPRMDGFTFVEQIRELPHYADIPVVIVTSLERESDKMRGMRVGAKAYITKGDFEQKSFIDTIKSLVP